METAMKAFSDIFEVSITPDDFEKQVDNLIDWDSFTIMNFMAEMSEKFGVTINIAQISAIDKVKDVVDLIYNCIM